jgi:hypothetical protein
MPKTQNDLLTAQYVAQAAETYPGAITLALASGELTPSYWVHAGNGKMRPIFRRGDVSQWVQDTKRNRRRKASR